MAIKTGEKAIFVGLSVLALAMMGWRMLNIDKVEEDKGIPFYTTSSNQFMKKAGVLYSKYDCSNCHSLWTMKNIMETVPAPALDGIGSLKDEAWFYRYFSAENPQSILPTRLKPKWKMPSFANIPEEDRRILVRYMASLKVKDWYLQDTIKREQEKLTGKPYKPKS